MMIFLECQNNSMNNLKLEIKILQKQRELTTVQGSSGRQDTDIEE